MGNNTRNRGSATVFGAGTALVLAVNSLQEGASLDALLERLQRESNTFQAYEIKVVRSREYLPHGNEMPSGYVLTMDRINIVGTTSSS